MKACRQAPYTPHGHLETAYDVNSFCLSSSRPYSTTLVIVIMITLVSEAHAHGACSQSRWQPFYFFYFSTLISSPNLLVSKKKTSTPLVITTSRHTVREPTPGKKSLRRPNGSPNPGGGGGWATTTTPTHGLHPSFSVPPAVLTQQYILIYTCSPGPENQSSGSPEMSPTEEFLS
jgi:hypothetical protein